MPGMVLDNEVSGMTRSAEIIHRLKQHRLFISRSLYIAVLAAYAAVIVFYWAEISRLITAHPFAILYAVAFSLVAIAAQAFNFIDLIHAADSVRFLPAYRIWALSNLLNYVAPFQPGLVVRGVFFKSRNIGYIRFALGTMRQMQLSLWIGLALLVLFFPVDISLSGYMRPAILAVFLLWLAVMIYTSRGGRLPILPSRHSEKASFLLAPPSLQQFLLIGMQYLLIAASYYCVLTEMGIGISPATSFLIAIGLVFSTIISLTPNNIGLQELIIGTVVYSITSTDAYTVVVPVIFRLSHIASCGIILLLSYPFFRKTD